MIGAPPLIPSIVSDLGLSSRNGASICPHSLGVEEASFFRLSLLHGLCFNTLMSIIHLTSFQLRQIADLKEKIEALELQLAGIIVVAGKPQAPVQAPEPPQPSKPGKRTMSPAHKAKIRAAQQLRWAKYNAARPTIAVESATFSKPAKRKMSAAGRAAIAAGARARWAKVKAGKK